VPLQRVCVDEVAARLVPVLCIQRKVRCKISLLYGHPELIPHSEVNRATVSKVTSLFIPVRVPSLTLSVDLTQSAQRTMGIAWFCSLRSNNFFEYLYGLCSI